MNVIRISIKCFELSITLKVENVIKVAQLIGMEHTCMYREYSFIKPLPNIQAGLEFYMCRIKHYT